MRENFNPYALVTGASSGIGFQYARLLADKGYNLLIVSNEEDALHEKKQLLKQQFPVEVIAMVCDLGTQDAAKELYDACQEQQLEVEVLINNAGVYHSCDFLKDTAEYNHLILNLHVHTPAFLIYYFGQDMVKRHKGYILNMSSITGDIAVQRLASYGATKRFLRNFSRSLHAELYHEGVKVTAVCPGAVATKLYNISDKSSQIGVKLGYIITPERLAKMALKAMFHGKSQITPGFINHVGIFFIRLIPIQLLRWIRKRNIY